MRISTSITLLLYTAIVSTGSNALSQDKDAVKKKISPQEIVGDWKGNSEATAKMLEDKDSPEAKEIINEIESISIGFTKDGAAYFGDKERYQKGSYTISEKTDSEMKSVYKVKYTIEENTSGVMMVTVADKDVLHFALKPDGIDKFMPTCVFVRDSKLEIEKRFEQQKKPDDSATRKSEGVDNSGNDRS